MPTKCCWVIHGSLTSERKASTSPSSFINHSTLLLNRALKRQAPCFYMHFEVRTLDRLGTRRRVGSTRRRGNHMHDHSRFQRDINDVTGVSLSLSLSLSLPLTKVTDAQYRKRFRASYNNSYTSVQSSYNTQTNRCLLWISHCCPITFILVLTSWGNWWVKVKRQHSLPEILKGAIIAIIKLFEKLKRYSAMQHRKPRS